MKRLAMGPSDASVLPLVVVVGGPVREAGVGPDDEEGGRFELEVGGLALKYVVKLG